MVIVGAKDKSLIGTLDDLERYRDLVLRATQTLFKFFYESNFQGDERVLEIGSGIGFLRRNWPREFNGTWVELDKELAFLREAEKRFSQGTYVCGSAYELPFPNESFDAVCGLGSFDSNGNLEIITREASRVLRKGGLFLQMFDTLPHLEPILRDLQKRNIPYRITKPKGEKNNDQYGIEIIPPLEAFTEATKSAEGTEQKN